MINNKNINKNNNKNKNKDISKLKIGSSINTSNNGFITSADHAQTIGANFYQIFLGSPHTLAAKRHTHKELTDLNTNLVNANITLVVHGSYILNFCNPPENYIHKAAIRLLSQDLTDSIKINAIGVIVHMGKKLELDYNTALNNYVLGIKEVLKQSPNNSTVIFETAAGQGTEICTSIISLYILYSKFTKEEKQRIKFCIDTCHVFSAGYDLSNTKYLDIFFQFIKYYLGWGKIACIHLNDSKTGLNERKDRHCDLGHGHIGSRGLKKIVRKCYKKNIPLVLETPCENNFTSGMQIKLVKDWCNIKEDQVVFSK